MRSASRRQHPVHAVGGDVDVVAGDVVGGEGVVLPALAGDRAGELALGHGRGPLEHQVLEEVREAGRAGLLVARAHPVPRLDRDDGAAAVFDDQHTKAVVEGRLGDGRGLGRRRWCEGKNHHGQQGETHRGRPTPPCTRMVRVSYGLPGVTRAGTGASRHAGRTAMARSALTRHPTAAA